MWFKGDSFDRVSSSVRKRSHNIWLRAWSGRWLSAHRKVDLAMFEFVCRPGWRLYKNLFIFVGECALTVLGAWNQGSLPLVVFIIHWPELNGSRQQSLKWHLVSNSQVLSVEFSSMSESSQTSPVDLCYEKRCSCLVFPYKQGEKTWHTDPKFSPPPPPLIAPPTWNIWIWVHDIWTHPLLDGKNC